jgi:hypothetical protein
MSTWRSSSSGTLLDLRDVAAFMPLRDRGRLGLGHFVPGLSSNGALSMDFEPVAVLKHCPAGRKKGALSAALNDATH